MMAHARIIRQNFFNDPLIAEKYSVDERYLLIGLACVADDFGRFWYNPANIRSGIFPTDDNITSEWVAECLEKFTNDFILCKYDIENILYAHFPKWFDKGWYLKQRVDHPREYQSPDCPICETERKKREISRSIKYNSVKKKKNKYKESKDNIIKDNIIEQLTSHVYSNKMLHKYPLVTKIKYKQSLDTYLDWVVRNEAFEREHSREFEGRLAGLQDKLDSNYNDKNVER